MCLLLGSLANPWVIDFFGRVPLLGFGLLFQAMGLLLAMGGLLLQIAAFIVLGLGLFMFTFAFSLGGVLFIYRAEILPAKVIMISAISQLVPNILISYFTLSFIRQFGVFPLFFMFFIITFGGLLYFMGMAFETKGKTDTQI